MLHPPGQTKKVAQEAGSEIVAGPGDAREVLVDIREGTVHSKSIGNPATISLGEEFP